MPSRKASWLGLHPRNRPECQQIRHRVWSAVSVRLEVNVVDMENRLAKSHLVLTGVAVEKLDFCTNGLKSGDRKCLAGPRRSLVGHPGAMNFLRILRG